MLIAMFNCNYQCDDEIWNHWEMGLQHPCVCWGDDLALQSCPEIRLINVE